MATLPAPDAPIEGLSIDEIDQIVLVRVDQVELGERLREIDTVWAEALGTMMKRDGQRDPIDVRRLPGQKIWTLGGAGGHRLTGARLAGLEYIKARVVTADRAESRMREVQDNLHRRDLDPIDRAAFMAELVSLKRSAAGLPSASHRSSKVNARWKQDLHGEADLMLETISSVYGFTEEVGEQLGLTGRTIRNDLMIYRRIAPSLIQKLRQARHPVTTNATQLRALAKLDPAEQDEVVLMLLRDRPDKPACKSVGEAVAQIRGSNRPVDPEAKRLSTFVGTYTRMGLAEKKGALRQLPLPTGTRLIDDSYRPAPAEKYRIEMIEAMSEAKALLDTLYEGTGGVDDDQIHAARTKLQMALLATNAGAVPTPEGLAA